MVLLATHWPRDGHDQYSQFSRVGTQKVISTAFLIESPSPWRLWKPTATGFTGQPEDITKVMGVLS